MSGEEWMNEERYLPFRRIESPWYHPYELFKMAIMMWTIPLRLLLCCTWVLLYYIMCKIALLGNPDITRPLGPVRRWFVSTYLGHVPYVFRLTAPWLSTLGFWNIRVNGPRDFFAPDGTKANIVVSNHACWTDALVLMHALPVMPSYVAKHTVAELPIAGTITKAWQSVFVRRSETKHMRTEGQKGLDQHVSDVCDELQARAVADDMPPLLAFPEGTTTNNRCLITFKKGPFWPGAPVKPVVIKYEYNHFSMAWESCKFPYHLLRCMCQFVNHCEITLLPVYVPSEEEKKSPRLYANNVRKVMAEALGVPVVESDMHAKVEYLERTRGSFTE